jgi:FAD/FMN-containing dehydrogenase
MREASHTRGLPFHTRLVLNDLRRRHRGPIIAADDGNYDAARVTYNGMFDRRPELVARPLDVGDVVTAVAYARQCDLPVSIRGGGHSVVGHCIGDGALVIDLRLMRTISVDPATRTATCGGGALWEDFDPACLREGLATPGGTFGDTGVAGLTLGGGIGHLVGLYGLTLDNLVGATVVTAGGDVVHASDDESDDLFWALRGGGGNFGVVTEFAFRIHPVGELLGGALMFSPDATLDVLVAWRELMRDAPDELACFVVLEPGPLVSVAYFGDIERGTELIQPLLRAADPEVNTVRPMHYAELQELFGRVPFGYRQYWSGRFMSELTDDLFEQTAARPTDGLSAGVLFEPLHGAAKRVAPDATAFSGRDAEYNVTYIATWSDPANDERHIDAARSYAELLAPRAVGGGYINYASEVTGDGMATEYGAQRLARLRDVKRQYDPDNRFRFNHNITPT